MQLEQQAIQGLSLLRWDVATDERGSFARLFCRDALAAADIDFSVAQLSLSRNPALHTLRGLHFQAEPHGEAKIVACVRGRVWDVVVDLRPRSATFGAWQAIELDADAMVGLRVPAGCAHGYLTLEADCDLLYVIDTPYTPSAVAGIRWDDPDLAIAWPAAPVRLSARDAALPTLAAVRSRLADV